MQKKIHTQRAEFSASVELCSCDQCKFREVLFRSLTHAEYREVCSYKFQKDFAKGDDIVLQGERSDKFLYLKSGLAKIYIKSRDGERILRLSKPLDFLSVSANFAHETFPYSIKAITSATVCFFDFEKIKEVMSRNGNFGLELLRKISESCNNALLINVELNRRNLRGRVAFILLLLAEEIYKSRVFELPLTRREIAEIIHMSTENVIRIFSELRREKIIKTNGRIVEIADFDRLLFLSNVN